MIILDVKGLSNIMNMEFQLILLILSAIISFSFGIVYKSVRVGKPEKDSRLDDITNKVNWLKEVHDKRDQNGMPLWYVPRELQQLCFQTSNAMTLVNRNLDDIKEILSHNTRVMEKILIDH